MGNCQSLRDESLPDPPHSRAQLRPEFISHRARALPSASPHAAPDIDGHGRETQSGSSDIEEHEGSSAIQGEDDGTAQLCCNRHGGTMLQPQEYSEPIEHSRTQSSREVCQAHIVPRSKAFESLLGVARFRQ